MPQNNSGLFNNHVSLMQGYAFQPNTAVISTAQEQPINIPAGRAEDSSECGQSACSADSDRTTGKD